MPIFLEYMGVEKEVMDNVRDIQVYKKLKGDAKVAADVFARMMCKIYQLGSDEEAFKGSEKVLEELCCELNDYCSFYYQPWFYFAATAVGFLIIHIVSLAFVYFMCRGKGGKL
ncbi:unnamed protein product [Caenorhabditis brenneri]